MAILNRLSRLLKADFHAVLDSLEEPQILLRHSIREMQDCLSAAEQETQRLAAQIQRAQAQLAQTQAGTEKIEQELDICFAAGDEQLARKLLRRKLEHQQLHHYLEKQIEQDNSTLQQHRDELQSQRDTLVSLQQKAELFEQHCESNKAGAGAPSPTAFFEVSQDDVELAFLREKSRRAVQ